MQYLNNVAETDKICMYMYMHMHMHMYVYVCVCVCVCVRCVYNAIESYKHNYNMPYAIKYETL